MSTALLVTFSHSAPVQPVSARFTMAGLASNLKRMVPVWMAGALLFCRWSGPRRRSYAAAMPVLTAAILTFSLTTAMVASQREGGKHNPETTAVRQSMLLAQTSPPPLASSPAAAPEPGAPENKASDEAAGAAAPAAQPPVSLPDHKIVPDDVLSVVVFEEPELSKVVRVDEDGMIALPVIQRKLQAAGLLPRNVETEVTRELLDEKILLHPLVTVSIVEYALRTVSVVGDVRTPGQFKISAPMKLLEALAKAGWVTSDAGPEVSVSTPDSGKVVKINIAHLLQNPGPAENITLSGGEVVNVPGAEKELAAMFPEGPKVWVTGKVDHPQAYSIANPADATVSKTVARVVGPTQNYDKTAYIYRRDESGNRRVIPVPLKDIMHGAAKDVALQADDVLLIPGEKDKKLLEYYDTHPPTAPWETAK